MATNVLDRLEALLAAATPGPWSYDDGITDDETGERGKPQSLYGQGMVGGLPLFCGVEPVERDDRDGRLVAALRNAAPALIRLARAALWLDNVPRHTGDHDTEIAIAKKEGELGDAIDALGEVRL